MIFLYVGRFHTLVNLFSFFFKNQPIYTTFQGCCAQSSFPIFCLYLSRVFRPSNITLDWFTLHHKVIPLLSWDMLGEVGRLLCTCLDLFHGMERTMKKCGKFLNIALNRCANFFCIVVSGSFHFILP